ncbi:archease [bacterium]|nr:archease [bacterium]
MSSGFKIVDHTADVGLKVWGTDGPELFREAAVAMMSQVVDLSTIESVQKQAISLKADTPEELLHRWLREILFLIDKGLVFNQFHIEKHNLSEKKAAPYFLEGYLVGESLDTTRHRICNEVKAVTRHNFYVKTKGPWWEANILLDV